MEIERLSASDYTPKGAPAYIDTLGFHRLYDKIAFISNLLLVGPKGVGKSLSVASYSAAKGYPTITFDCSEDVRRSQLIGMFILRGNETPFILGPLTSAIEVANEVGSCVLILEEINALSPHAQKLLNPLTDFRGKIDVPEAKKVFSLKDKCKLWVVGTMNSALSYTGVYQLNEDLKSRFRMLPVGYPDPTTEKEILASVIRSKELNLKDKAILDRLLTLAQETRQGKVEYALSTRDLVQIIEDTALVGIDNALLMILGKYEGGDREAMTKRIDSIFAIKPTKIKV